MYRSSTNKNPMFELLSNLPMLQVPSDAWEIVKVTPYSPLAYGAVLLVLVAGNLVFYRNWKEESKYNRERDDKVLEFQQKTLSLMTRVELRLNDQKGEATSISNLNTRLEDIHDILKDINRK